MKQATILGAGALVLFVGIYVYLSANKAPATPPVEQTPAAVYANSELGLSFAYMPGSQGYVLEERTPTDESAGLVRTIMLTRSEDVRAGVPEGGEGPAVLSIEVFKNPENLSPRIWADKHVQYSNVNLKTSEVTEAMVGGANAIRYMADGLYASENFVVAEGEHIYVLHGMFMTQDSALRGDFSVLVASLQFIPAGAAPVQGKLNINAVCDGALAYMTFPDGQQADKFVSECKEGKHPEVIETYLKQLGVSDGVAI